MPNIHKAKNLTFRVLLPYLIFLALLVIFRPIIIDTLNSILVNPIFSKIPSDHWTDIGVFGLIGIGIGYWFKHWREVNFNTFFIGLLASFSILYLDKHDKTWLFTPTNTFPNITYLTFGSFSIFALLSISYCKHIIHYIDLRKKPKPQSVSVTKFINPDKPIKGKALSLLPKRNFDAEKLAEKSLATMINTQLMVLPLTENMEQEKPLF